MDPLTTALDNFVLLVAGPTVADTGSTPSPTSPLPALDRPPGELKNFTPDHNAAITTVLLTILGDSNVGRGLGGLFG